MAEDETERIRRENQATNDAIIQTAVIASIIATTTVFC